jgi:hypothetical protein
MRDERMLMADYLLMRRCLSGQTQRHVLPTLRSPPLDRVLKILVVAISRPISGVTTGKIIALI